MLSFWGGEGVVLCVLSNKAIQDNSYFEISILLTDCHTVLYMSLLRICRLIKTISFSLLTIALFVIVHLLENILIF